MMERTTITVSDEVWRYLDAKKDRGDSMDDILRQELGIGEEAEAASEEHDPRPEVDRERLRDELAGSGQVAERRADEILAMYGRLRELGVAEKGDLLEAVDVDATGYASAESVWSNMVKGRDTLRALPGVETPSTGKTEWRYSLE